MATIGTAYEEAHKFYLANNQKQLNAERLASVDHAQAGDCINGTLGQNAPELAAASNYYPPKLTTARQYLPELVTENRQHPPELAAINGQYPQVMAATVGQYPLASVGGQYPPALASVGGQYYPSGLASIGEQYPPGVASVGGQYPPGVASVGAQYPPGVVSGGGQYPPELATTARLLSPGSSAPQHQPDKASSVVAKNYPRKPGRKYYKYQEPEHLQMEIQQLPNTDESFFTNPQQQPCEVPYETRIEHLKMFTASSILKTLEERNIPFEEALRRRHIFTQATASNNPQLAYQQELMRLRNRYLTPKGPPSAPVAYTTNNMTARLQQSQYTMPQMNQYVSTNQQGARNVPETKS